MDSTTAEDEPGDSTPMPSARQTAATETAETNIDRASRESELAQILVARHEQLLASSDLSVAIEVPRPFRLACADADTLTAEVEQLDDCLRRVERARRERVVRPTPFDEAEAMLNMQATDQRIGPFQIGRFEIERELGRGGLGVVLLAHDPVLRRQVALKVPRPEALLTPDLRKRFQREAQAAARLTHPHIVPVYEVGEAGAVCFIAAEYVAGPNLGEWLKMQAGPIEPRAAAALVADLAGAMDYAHRQGVLHRDLKPSNILLERRDVPAAGGGEADDLTSFAAKITDFGLARLVDQARDETRSGAIIGTPAYMSPEQATGTNSQLGPASDVYSLGAILYELLSGKPPFRGESDAMTLVQVISDEPVPLRRLQAQLPRDLEAICLRCLEKKPSSRYSTAGDLAADLARFLAGESTLARPLSAGQALVSWARRRPTHAAIVALAVVGFVAALGGAAFHTARLDRALQLAESNESKAIENQGLAERETQRANLQLYAAQMRMASLAVEREDFGLASEILSEYDQGKPLAQLRGVEWYILQSQAERPDHKRDRGYSVLLKHPDEVYTVRFVPGTEWVATGSQDGLIRFWDYKPQKLVHEFKKHERCVNQIRFSPDGTQMASASCDKSVVVWRMSKDGPPEPLHTFSGKTPFRSLEFSPDGAELAAGDEQGVLHFWDPRSGQFKRIYETDSGSLSGLSWSRDGRVVAVATNKEMQPYWTLFLSGENWEGISPSYNRMFMAADIAYSPDGKRLAINDRNLRLRQFTTDSGIELAAMESEGVRLSGLAWSPDSQTLATLGSRGDVRIYDANTGKLGNSIDTHPPGVHLEDITFHPSGEYVASASRTGDVFITNACIYDESRPILKLPLGQIRQAVLDPELKRLSISSDAGFRELNVDTGELIANRAITGDRGADPRIGAVGLSHAVSVERHGVVVHDLKRGTSRAIPRELSWNTQAASLLYDSPTIMALVCDEKLADGSTQKLLRVIDAATIRELHHEPCGVPPYAIAVSPDHSYLVRGFDSTGLVRIDMRTGERTTVPNASGTFYEIEFSLDGSQLVGRSGVDVRLWDTESTSLKHVFRSHSPPARAALSADGRTLAIVADREITFANTATGQEMHKLLLPRNLANKGTWGRFAQFVFFSADGRRIALVSNDRHTHEVEVYMWGDLDQ